MVSCQPGSISRARGLSLIREVRSSWISDLAQSGGAQTSPVNTLSLAISARQSILFLSLTSPHLTSPHCQAIIISLYARLVFHQ